MRFLDFNYVIQDNVTLIASSAQTNFPVSNLKSHFRNKVWRSSGTFVIDSTNKHIDFRETSGGPEITATLTEGTYTISGLTAHIASVMTAATLNARTYTVSYATATGKWTITGETFLELLWASGTNTATSVGPSIGYAVADMTGAVTYEAASRAIHTEESVVIDFNTSEEIDSVVLFPDPLEHATPGGFSFTSGAVIRYQENETNEWSSPAVDEVISIDEQFGVATKFFTTANENRYHRIKIVDPKNPSLYVEMGGLVIAKATQLTDPVANGFTWTNRDTSNRTRTNFGNEYTDQRPIFRELGVSYEAMLYDDIKTLDRMFKRNGVRIPVTVVLDGEELCFDKDHFLIYSKFQNQLEHSHISYKLFNQDLAFQEIL